MNKSLVNSIKCLTISSLALACQFGAATSRAAGLELLANPGFEGSYSPVPVEGGAAIVTGVMADGWADSSSSSDVKVKYDESRNNVHGGTSAQNITVSSVGNGSIIFGQNVSGLVHGHHYSLSVWERGDGKLQVTIGLSDSPGSANSYGQQEATPPADWQHVTVEVTPTRDGSAFVFLQIKQAGTVTIDDASLTEEPTKT